jgi:hypothetical protein
MVGQARSDDSADHRVTHREGGQLWPEDVGRGIQAHVHCNEEEVEGCERQGERTHSPRKPGGRSGVYPTESSTLIACPFCHNPTLQHCCLLSVTTNAARIAFCAKESRSSENRKITSDEGKRCMLVTAKTGADFSRGCAPPAIRPRIPATHSPHSSIRESRLRRRYIQTLAWLLHSYVVCCSFGTVSGRSHSETWAGCILSLTIPTRSSLNASRSVSSLSLTEKASRVFLASYLLL